MKLHTTQEDLNKAVGFVSKVTTNKGQLVILANILVEAVDNEIKLAATNLEIGMKVTVAGRIDEEGAICVQGRNLAEFVNAISGGNIELVTDGDKLKIQGGKLKAVLAGMAASEFPAMKGKSTEGHKFQMERELVLKIAKEVVVAAAVDESRPVLTGVKLAVINGQLTIAGTDGFRMSKLTCDVEGINLAEAIILPAKTVAELARMIGDTSLMGQGRPKGEVEVEIVEEGNQVIVSYGKVELVSRVLAGNFPDVGKVIPSDFKTRCVVDREELLKEVRAVAIFARESNNIIKFKINNPQCTIKAVGGQSGEAEGEVEAEVEGEEVEIAFNYKYVIDFLQSVDGERVVLKASGALASGVWGVEGRDDLVHLVMPVRV